MNRLSQIRRAEAESHTAAYNAYGLYEPGSWLSRPIRALEALLPLYEDRRGMAVLDLGSGVGRNAIAAAKALPESHVTCVDILPMAIEKLRDNAENMGVSHQILGIAAPVDCFDIGAGEYDMILAGSVLEHLDSRESTVRTLRSIRDGIRPDGAVLIVMNTGVREWDASTGQTLEPQFEVNLPPEEAQALLAEFFEGWQVLWDRLIHYEYDVPRGDRNVRIASEVITYTARRPK